MWMLLFANQKDNAVKTCIDYAEQHICYIMHIDTECMALPDTHRNPVKPLYYFLFVISRYFSHFTFGRFGVLLCVHAAVYSTVNAIANIRMACSSPDLPIMRSQKNCVLCVLSVENYTLIFHQFPMPFLLHASHIHSYIGVYTCIWVSLTAYK